jgi:peptidoglycan/xylan/chitin deacetylase (PgdA/CDA1 family)
VIGPTIPRRVDRKRRIRTWSGCMLAGAAIGAALWLGVGGTAGAALGFAALLTGLLFGHRSMIAPPGVPILTYHSVSPDASWLPWADEISVHPETLRNHLAAIGAMGCTVVSTSSLVEARRAGRPLPSRPVVLHFDDGYFDNWLHAVPLLHEANAPATFFASLDFIAPGERLRGGGDDRGYMNWAELAALDADPLFEVEPHGIDHGRVAVSTRTVGTLTAANWRSLAWMQWAKVPGPKHDWYLWQEPPAVPLGAPVPESEGALAAPAWLGDRAETGSEYRSRVAAHLGRCVDEFAARLGRAPATFCWPENRVSSPARAVAAAAGYRATTGGAGRNTATEPPQVLSRIHAGDRALGFRCGAAERFHIRAVIGLFEGNHYWYLVTGPMSLARKLVMALRPGLARLATRVPDVSIRDSRNLRRPRPVSR